MSKFVSDPQIQSLRAMRAGDIAIALPTPVVLSVGVAPVSFAQPLVTLARSCGTVESVEAIVAMPSESPVVSDPFTTTLSTDTYQSFGVACTNALEALTATPSESPVVGIGFTTSVI